MTESEKLPVLAVVGPTASGKTALGVMLAKQYHGEVISADSMQIYQGLDIATAKPTPEEQDGVPHHLIGCIPIDAAFSVADYLSLAKPLIQEIHDRNHLPIVVGGTGLYVSSLLSNVQLAPTKQDPALRQQFLQYAAEHGNDALHDKLKALDPQAAAEIHPNNLVRVVRALEVCTLTGKTFTACKAESHQIPSPYRSLVIGLTYERSVLYDRINERVDQMVAQGLVDEAYAVYQNEALRTAYHAIGYKELIPYFDGVMSLETCIDKIKQETRRYAKRQLTWFRKNNQIQWIILDRFDKKQKIMEKCQKIRLSHYIQRENKGRLYRKHRKSLLRSRSRSGCRRKRSIAMNKNINLQDVFLNQARKERIGVTIFLTNGFQFKGVVKGFDSYVVILECDGKQNLVYKHAISTIIPIHPISILEVGEE